MDLKQIKELMAAMEKTDLTKIRIKDKDKYELELERSAGPVVVHAPPPPHHYHPEIPKSSGQPLPHHRMHEEPHKEADGKFIVAPLVGTVYYAPSPEDPPFVKVGDQVDENTVVYIIEAMKVMNEVKAGMSGTVAEILVKNGHPVEFAAKVMRIT